MKVIDETPDYILTAQFDSITLRLDLQLFDHKEEVVSFFELSLTNESLTEDMLMVFGSVGTLWETSFLKKENYTVEGNGRLYIGYGVQLKSDLLEKEIYIHMLPVPKAEREIFKAYCMKIKGDKERIEEEKEEMREQLKEIEVMKEYLKELELTWRIIEAYQSYVPIIPLQNNFSHLFSIKGNVV